MKKRITKLMFVTSTVFIALFICMTSYASEDKNLSPQDKFTRAMKCLDGKEGFYVDHKRAESLLRQTIAQDPNNAEAHFHLAALICGPKFYEEAGVLFKTTLRLGMTEARLHIDWLQMEGRIKATPEEQFLSICHVRCLNLPPREGPFAFGCRMTLLENSGDMHVPGVLCADHIYNKDKGIIKSPIIWIRNTKGFRNEGLIVAQIIILGLDRLIIPKDQMIHYRKYKARSGA